MSSFVTRRASSDASGCSSSSSALRIRSRSMPSGSVLLFRIDGRSSSSRRKLSFAGAVTVSAPKRRRSAPEEPQFSLEALANEEPCVLVGRCANWVLRDRDDVLDVFIHAGRDYRIQRTMEKLEIPEKKAGRVLKRTDRARKAYYKNYTGCDWNDPNLYHAIVNSDRLGVEACVDVICRMYHGEIKGGAL